MLSRGSDLSDGIDGANDTHQGYIFPKISTVDNETAIYLICQMCHGDLIRSMLSLGYDLSDVVSGV